MRGNAFNNTRFQWQVQRPFARTSLMSTFSLRLAGWLAGWLASCSNPTQTKVRKLLSEKHAEIAQLLRDLLVAKSNEICASLNAQ